MIAEIHHKVPSEWRNREDVLTGSFFGALRYASSAKALLTPLLDKARFGEDKGEKAYRTMLEKVEDWEFKFWEKLEGREIDLLIISKTKKYLIGVEVKFHSGLSSDDNNIEKEQKEDQEKSQNQLAIYTDLLGQCYKDYERHLLFLAKAIDARPIYERSTAVVKVGDTIAAIKSFSYCSWERFHACLLALGELKDSRDELIRTDLCRYLEDKGLDGFLGFKTDKLIEPKVNTETIWRWDDTIFDTNKLINQQVKTDLNYVFE